MDTKSIIQIYKHRYRNVSIKDIVEQPFKIEVGDIDIYLDVEGEKAIFYKDDKDNVYHVSFCKENLDVLTEVFISKFNNENVKVLVIENDDSHQAMILSTSDNTKYLNLVPIKNSKGEISTYMPKGCRLVDDNILEYHDAPCVINTTGILYPRKEEHVDIRYNKDTGDCIVLKK